MIERFNAIARNLIECEEESKEEIEDELFIAALFKRYGKATYTGHLQGKSALRIYHEQLRYMVYDRHVPDKDSEKRMLKGLAESRGKPRKR